MKPLTSKVFLTTRATTQKALILCLIQHFFLLNKDICPLERSVLKSFIALQHSGRRRCTNPRTIDLFDWINQKCLQLSSLIPTSGVNCTSAMEWSRNGSWVWCPASVPFCVQKWAGRGRGGVGGCGAGWTMCSREWVIIEEDPSLRTSTSVCCERENCRMAFCFLNFF